MGKGTPPEMINVQEAAKRLGIDAMNLGQQIINGTFPIGWADNPTGRRWRYHIIRAEFEDLMAGKISTNQAKLADMIVTRVAEKLQESGAVFYPPHMTKGA